MITDLIVVVFILSFLWRGGHRGFIRSLIGPAAFLLATAIAFAYYSATQNLIVSLAIGLLGPFLLCWVFIFLLGMFNSKEGQTAPSGLSRLLGMVATVCWGMFIILPVLFLLALMPPVTPTLAAINTDIKRSLSFQIVKPWMNQFTPVPAVDTKSAAAENLREDPRMQELLKDPDVAKAIENKDYAKLLSNPKIMALAQDPVFVKKLLASAYAQPPQQPPSK